MNRPPRLLTALPMGLAFELADLVMVQGWSSSTNSAWSWNWTIPPKARNTRRSWPFTPEDSSFRRWMVWRGASDIVVQPMMGRASRYASVAEALEH